MTVPHDRLESQPDAAHRAPARRSVLRGLGLLGLAAAGTAVVAGCGDDPNSVASQARSGDRKGYISGDGTIEVVKVGDRGAAVNLSGTTLEGAAWTMAQASGKVLVLNVWGSWCPPCIKEQPALQGAWDALQKAGKPVAFLGLDSQEDPQTGLAFVREHKVTYPSLAYDGGVPLLALQGKVVATPTTLVLDKQGRIAARVSGEVTQATLVGLVDDVLAESA